MRHDEGAVHNPVARLVLIASFSCAAAGLVACRGRAHRAAPTPSASVADTASPPDPLPEPLPTGSAVVPSLAVFADGGAPKGYERATVWNVIAADDGAAVLLVDAKNIVLPIFVGGTEALTIQLRVDREKYTRPLTHDLLSTVIAELGGQPVKVQVDDLRDDTYFGSVFVRQGERVVQIDARPSDAIALALGSGVPIFVSQAVMLSSGVPRDEIERDQREKRMGDRKKGNPISL
jgi:bifunctional DNase/RNase